MTSTQINKKNVLLSHRQEVDLNLRNEETLDLSDNFMTLKFYFNNNLSKICFQKLHKNNKNFKNTKSVVDREI